MLLRPLPYPQSERIVALWQTARNSFADSVGGTVSHLNYLVWKRDAKSFESLALFGASRSILSGAGDAEVIPTAIVTPDFFRAFSAAPVMGREFTPAEDRPGGPPVIVASHAFWRERLGSAADVLDRTVDISGRPRQIIGVAPAGFDFPRGARIWMPVGNDDNNCGRACVYLDGIGRLAPGVTVEAARQEMDAIARRLETEFPAENTNVAVGVRLLRDETVGTARAGLLLLLLGAVAMVLLIACANVANLLLVRASGRQSDVAVRAALGASRSRLVSHLLMESVVLATAGGVAGSSSARGALTR